jgi:hypothetical protein
LLRPTSRRRPLWRRPRVVVPVVAVAVLAAAVPTALAMAQPSVRVEGLADGALLGAQKTAALQVRIAAGGGDTSKATVSLDGHSVPVTWSGSTATWRPTGLTDGRHQLRVRIPGSLPMTSKTVTRTFAVDTTPPSVTVADTSPAASLRDQVTMTGTATGARSVTVDGKPTTLQSGHFSVTFPRPPAGARLVATDAAGNTTTRILDVAVHHPRMVGVHMTADAWTYPPLRDPVLALARAHQINTVELDVKDEDGLIGYRSSVPLAARTGANGGTHYDPAKTLAELHHLGVRVVGRIVAFRDPKLATWAWQHGHKDWVVQTPAGTPWAGTYGLASFTNFASPDVQAYDIALATEAAKLGFDDVMYDYVRRPDGKLSQMRFPGLKGTPEQAVATFVKDTRGPVRAAGAYLGAAVFGVSATRPAEVAQNISLFAKSVDYVSPMVYPSHWAAGEYDVADPNAQPFDIVNRSLKDFQAKVKGTTAQVFPWLQDFSLGVTYGPAEVTAQIKAAAADHIDSFLLWNAGCSYHGQALAALH